MDKFEESVVFISAALASSVLYSLSIKLFAPLYPDRAYHPAWWQAIGIGMLLGFGTMVSDWWKNKRDKTPFSTRSLVRIIVFRPIFLSVVFALVVLVLYLMRTFLPNL